MNSIIIRAICLQPMSVFVRLALGIALVAPFASQPAVAADTEISTSVGPQTWTSDNFTVTDTGAVAGPGVNAIDVTAPGSGTLTNRGTISAPGGNSIYTYGRFGSIVNSGTIADGYSGIYAVNPDGGSITNDADGVFEGSDTGIVYAGSQLSVVTNAGLISGSFFALGATSLSIDGVPISYGTIGTLNNSGTISGTKYGISSSGGLIGTLNNSGTISGGSSAGSTGIYISRFGTLINDVGGVISGYSALHGVSFDTIINRGNIIGIDEGLQTASFGTSSLIQNDGLISGDVAVDVRSERVGALVNNGTIIGNDKALFVGSKGLGTLSNNGLIRGTILLQGMGSYPVIVPELLISDFTNSGTIEGDILATQEAVLVINGGTDRRGVLTGLDGAQGLIRTNFGLPDLPFYAVYNAINQDLTFGSGMLLLNDVIDAGDAHVRFAGASVQVNNAVAVTGNVVLSAGEMVFGATSPGTYGHYTIAGTAALDAGTVSLVSLGAPVFAPGQSYHVLSADSVTAGSVTTSVAGYDTSYSILDMGGSYDFVVSIDGIDQAYNTLGFTAGEMLLDSAAPVSGAIDAHQDDLVAALGVSGLAAGSAAPQGRLWGKLLRANADRETAAAATGYDANSTGLVVGADMLLANDLDAGLAVSWLRNIGHSADRLNGTDATIDSYQLTAYGAWRPADRMSLDAQLAYGISRIDQLRYVSILGAVADADYNGDQIAANLTASYALPLGASTSLTPYAGLRAVRVTTQSYGEQGAGIANLYVDDFSATNIRHDIGVKLATRFKAGESTIAPTLRLGWLHDYRDTPLSVAGTFGVTPFALSSARVAANGLGVGFAADLVANDSVTVGIDYDGDLRSDYQSNTVAIKAAIRF